MFTPEEFKLMNEGLDALKVRHQASNMMGDMLGMMVCGDDEQARAEIEKKMEERKREQEREQELEQEQVIVLKAKLITIKREQEAKMVAEEVDELTR